MCVAAVMMASPAFCQRSSGEIRVEVTDPSGAGVQATGRLENLTTGSDRMFETDTQGLFTLSDVPSGRYRLQISRSGFASQSLDLDLQSGAAIARTVTLDLSAQAYQLDVVSAAPLAGVDRTLDEMPTRVQTATARDIERSSALDLSDFMNRRLAGVYLNEVQGNPMQPDLNYRGYTASPLLGTPQGLSIYMDGVRLNQPFGEVVSWDLIPRIAVSELAVASGSNPLFGLNTLGGAVSMETKSGRSHSGGALSIYGGSFGRKAGELEYGRSHRNGLHYYVASSLFFEDGWRDDSPSNVRQFFGKVGWHGERASIDLTVAYANNSLIGNGLQEQRFLARDFSSIYTKPDVTANKSPFLNLRFRRAVGSSFSFAGNVYYRHIRTRTLNGDVNDDSLDQAVYQPGAAERAALAAAGYTGFPAAGESAANTPFPSWRCIAQSLLRDEPAEKCNGLLNRSTSKQHNYGAAGQLSWRGRGNQFTVGAAFDRTRADYAQLSQLGYLTPDRGVVGVPSFADGVTGGDEDGAPFDTRVDLRGRTNTGSIYATDTMTAGKLNLTLSGRYNRTRIDNRDLIRPAAGPGSLTGEHIFQRFNPAVGATYRPTGPVTLYANYSEGSRAPSSIELGCADPDQPCKLPNALAGDPPLNQVVTRTVEAGVRGSSESRVRWNVGWFRASNRDDLLFVASTLSGFGYFKNFGKTLRQGFEADASATVWRFNLGGNYTMIDATFRSPEMVGGEGNSDNDDGVIEIEPGNRIPLVPRHMFKAFAETQVTRRFLLDLGLVAVSGSIARGNENNEHEPDGRLFLGEGRSPGYAVVNLGARYHVHSHVELFVRVNNLFHRKYYTGAQLGPTGFTDTGAFIARPVPAVNGEFPLVAATFYAPGAPIGAWGGLRFKF